MEKQQSNKQCEILTDTGSQLRQARIERGIELDAVAAALCIPASHVTAIEHNDPADLPSAVFVRGYVNAYARFLGIDINGEFPASGEQGGPLPGNRLGPLGKLKRQTHPSDPWVRWTSLSVLAVVLVASLLWWQSQGDYPAPGIAVAQATMVTVDTSAGSVVVNPDQQASALGPARPGAISQRPAATAVEDQVMSLAGTGGDTGEAAALQNSALEQISLNAVFSDASWIEVRDTATGILFSGVKQAGDTLELSSTAIIDVFVGNAAAVKLSYNGSPVDLVSFTNGRNEAKIKLGL